MHAGKKRIGELLIEHGYISAEQLEEALQIQKTKTEKICNILIDLGYLSEQRFLEFLSSIPGTASIQLESCEMSPNILETVRHELAHRLELVPIGKIGNTLTVAMVCPLDEGGQKELEDLTGLKVRPVLCSRSAVLNTLQRYYGDPEQKDTNLQELVDMSGLEETLKLHGVARLIMEIEELPTLPDIVQRVSETASNPEASASMLADVIATDGSISAKLLRLANSPAFGFSRKISQIQQAIALLGFNETKALVMSVAVFDFLAENADLDFKAYWNHSFSCATLSRRLARSVKASEIETAFVAGLLHDVGKVALAMKLPGKQKKVSELCATGDMTLSRAEEAVFGLTHAEVGYLLGEHWFLPSNLTDAIRYHHPHEPDVRPTVLSQIVHLADIFCKLVPSDLKEIEEFDSGVKQVLESLGLSESVFREALRDFSETASDIPAL